MSGIRGSYPGGPRRGSAHGEKVGEVRAPGAPQVEPAEGIEARFTAAHRGVARWRRNKRVLSGLLAAMIVAAGVGIFLGSRAHQSSEEITDSRNAAGGGTAVFDPSFQTNRILDELWKMEMKQRQPGPP